ncbi:MAG: hypothetical protein WAS55_04135, partial [Saprospiraceae bacterium]
MAKGKSGLFFIKEPDGTIHDVSGMWEDFFRIQKDHSIDFSSEIKKWIRMDFDKINKSKTYQILPNSWRIILLDHIKRDYRFSGDNSVFEKEIVRLRESEEPQVRRDLYKMIIETTLLSRDGALTIIKTLIAEARQSIIQSKIETSTTSILEK